MTVAAPGGLSLCLQYLINSIAGSSTFRTEVSEANATAAKSYIYRGLAKDDGTQEPPRAIVRHLSGDMSELIATTQWGSSGPLRLVFEFENDSNLTYEENYITFGNKIGAILEEMQTLATSDPGAGPYLAFSGFRLIQLGQLDPQENNNLDYWVAEYEVSWKGQ